MDFEKTTVGQKVETFLNALNRIMIWSASLYITWHCYHFQTEISKYTMHVWLSTIGVSFFLSIQLTI